MTSIFSSIYKSLTGGGQEDIPNRLEESTNVNHSKFLDFYWIWFLRLAGILFICMTIFANIHIAWTGGSEEDEGARPWVEILCVTLMMFYFLKAYTAVEIIGLMFTIGMLYGKLLRNEQEHIRLE